jgi:hypothetical protein
MKNIIYVVIFSLLIFSCEKIELPLAPSNLAYEVISDKEIKLNWKDNSTNEAGFKIELKTENETFKVVASVGSNVDNITLANLTPDTNYEIRVLSYNNGGSSATYSNVVKAKTLLITPPVIETYQAYQITNTEAYIDACIISVGGGKYPPEWGVFYSTSNQNPKETDTKIVVNNQNGNGCYFAVLKQLLPNTTYYVRGYAKNEIGVGYGNVRTFKTLP